MTAPPPSLAPSEIATIAYLLMALALVAGGYMAGRRLPRTWVRDAVIWACIIAGLALAFTVLAPRLGYLA